MTTIGSDWKHLLLRAAVISGAGILVGYIFYGGLVFDPTMKASQFFISSITAGLAYAFLKSSKPRNLWAALLIYFIVFAGLRVEVSWWNTILNLVYISLITAAIFVYNYIVRKPFSKYVILRIIFASAITSIANGLIIVVLGAFNVQVIVNQFSHWFEAVEFNVMIGAMIGLAIGVGIELAEYFNSALVEYEERELTENGSEEQKE
jgi:hypothetical protein